MHTHGRAADEHPNQHYPRCPSLGWSDGLGVRVPHGEVAAQEHGAGARGPARLERRLVF